MSERHLAHAARFRPGYGEAMVYQALRATLLGDADRGAELAELAIAAEPESPYVRTIAALERLFAWDETKAQRQCERVLQLEPTSLNALAISVVALSEMGETEAATALGRKGVELGNRLPLFVAVLGRALGAAGQLDEVESLRNELDARRTSEFVSSVWMAVLDMMLDHRDSALTHLEAALEAREPTLLNSIRYRIWAPIDEEERFQAVVRGIGLPTVDR